MKSLSDQLAIIRDYQKKAPVPLVSLANALGIKVWLVDNWTDDRSGMIKKTGRTESGFEIFVNAKHPKVRQNFTIAHEIAHAVLHPTLIGDGITDDVKWRSGLPDPVEYQANKMAADILMPKPLVERYIAQGYRDPARLAGEFGVSERAMRIRFDEASRSRVLA